MKIKYPTVFLILLFLSGLIIAGIHFKEKFSVPRLLDSLISKKDPDPTITFVTSVDTMVLRLKVVVPCKTKGQRLEVERKIPRIQHILGNVVKEERVKNSLLHRDFGFIKQTLLVTLNKEMTAPVKEVHLEQFFLD